MAEPRNPPKAEVSDELLVARDGPILSLTLNRTERLNALTSQVVDQMRIAIEEADEDPEVRAIILTGAGRAFSAGADLSEGSSGPRRHLVEHYNPLILAICRVQVPIICAINGVAAGAGVSLALACDLRIAGEGARISLAFTQMALVPDAGMTWLLPRAVGLGRACELALLQRRLTARESLEWGLVNAVVPDSEIAAAARDMAAKLASGARSTGLTKRAFNLALDLTLEEAMNNEAELQEQAVRTEDFREALAAFRAKRRPEFRGR